MASGLGGPPGHGGPKRVVRTGLALVHENEIVYPAAGSEAMATRVADDASADIEVHFPVTIEVTGGGGGAAEAAGEDAARRQMARVGELLRRR